MFSDFSDHTAQNKFCETLIHYIRSAFQRCSNAFSVQFFLSEKSENETYGFKATAFDDQNYQLSHKHIS